MFFFSENSQNLFFENKIKIQNHCFFKNVSFKEVKYIFNTKDQDIIF